MELRVLRYFLTVAREGTATQAANVLHITQPTLSRQLAQLENELGVRLFEHQGRKILLTSSGMLLRRRAEEILELVDKTEQEVGQQGEDLHGTITIGAGESAALDILADCLDDFGKSYPHVRYELFSGTADAVKEKMDHGVLDIGLLLEPIDLDKYDFVRLNVAEHSGVFMRPDDPLAEKELITPADMAGKPLIVPNRYQSEIINWMGPHYREENMRYLITLPTMGAVLAAKGYGYMIAIQGCSPFQNPKRLIVKPLSNELTNDSLLAWKRGQPFGRVTEKFIEHVKCFLSMGELSF